MMWTPLLDWEAVPGPMSSPWVRVLYISVEKYIYKGTKTNIIME